MRIVWIVLAALGGAILGHLATVIAGSIVFADQMHGPADSGGTAMG